MLLDLRYIGKFYGQCFTSLLTFSKLLQLHLVLGPSSRECFLLYGSERYWP